MKNIKIETDITLLGFDELTPDDKELVNKAIEATNNAYAEYSRFYVGAALRLDNGIIITGANQENAAFPSGLCAERTAVFAAQAQYPQQPINVIAIAARNDNGLLSDPITPCGACRQVMLGIEDRYKKKIKVLLYGTKCIYCIGSAADLMPLSFVDACMK